MENQLEIASSILTGRGITKAFGSVRAGDYTSVLDGVDINVPQGALVSIVGPSGSGKSTLLYCLSGLDQPDTGQLTCCGEDMTALSERGLSRLYRSRIGFVFQSSNLVSSLTALENVVLPERLRHSRPSIEGARFLLETLGVGDRSDVRVSALSNGQQQRVALARVLLQEPDLVFADEPTGALDSEASGQVLEILGSYPRPGRSVVMVTHDVVGACRSDFVLVMKDGLITRRFRNPEPEQVFEAMEQK